MKTTILTALLVAFATVGFAQDSGTEILTESFDAATSLDGWNTAGDAASMPDDVTFEWDETAGVNSSGVMRFGGTNSDPSVGRAYIVEKIFSGVDFAGATSVTVSFAVKSEGLASSNLAILTEINGSIEENPSATGDVNDTDFTTFTFEHTSIPTDANFVKFSFNIAAGAVADAGGTILVDDISVTPNEGNGGETGEELLTNGDFEAGDDGSWYGNALNIQEDGGNSFNFANVETAGQAFQVNLSQRGLNITQGENYTLTFDASTGAGNTRTMIAGIGLSVDPFTAKTETVELTEQTQTFELVLTANFGSDDGRVLFDMGAETGVVVIDNVSLVQGGEVVEEPVTLPPTAAPAQPLREAGDVISIFSDAYDDINVDTYSADFDDSDVEELLINGNPTLRIDFTNFVGVDFQSDRQDASEMTHFHMDFYTNQTDLVGSVFNSKFSQWGGTGAEVSAFELPINTGTTPAIESGTWVTIDVPLTQWSGDLTRDDIVQFLITSNLDVVYVDNIYLYKDGPTTNTTLDAFSLLGPADGTTLELTGDGSTEAVITWEEATSNIDDVTYTWVADAVDGDFSDPLLSIPADMEGAETSLTLPFSAIDQALAGLGVAEGESVTVDWTVIAQAGDNFQLADETFEITIVRNLSTSNEVTESPNRFALNQNYPNPFNPTTTISYNLPASGEVTLEVFNVTGQKVATLVNGVQSAGSHTATFDASNLSSGIYMYRLESGNSIQVRKMLLIK